MDLVGWVVDQVVDGVVFLNREVGRDRGRQLLCCISCHIVNACCIAPLLLGHGSRIEWFEREHLPAFRAQSPFDLSPPYRNFQLVPLLRSSQYLPSAPHM
jgi:hypothetical protein